MEPPLVTADGKTLVCANVSFLTSGTGKQARSHVTLRWLAYPVSTPPGHLGVVSHGKFSPLPSAPSFLAWPGPAW